MAYVTDRLSNDAMLFEHSTLLFFGSSKDTSRPIMGCNHIAHQIEFSAMLMGHAHVTLLSNICSAF